MAGIAPAGKTKFQADRRDITPAVVMKKRPLVGTAL
jgi:hypothetical protein